MPAVPFLQVTVTINNALIYFLILLRGGGELCPSLLKNHWQMFNFTVLVRGRAGTQTQLPSLQWVIRILSIIVCYWESEISGYLFLESMSWATDWVMICSLGNLDHFCPSIPRDIWYLFHKFSILLKLVWVGFCHLLPNYFCLGHIPLGNISFKYD